MTTTLGTSYSVRWRACAVAVGTSNTIVGAVLGLMYGLYSFPFTGVPSMLMGTRDTF